MIPSPAASAVRTALTQITGRSSGDNLQASLQALGMNQNMAALQGALHDLSQGNLAGYQKNLFEAFTGVDPGKLRNSMAKAFSCGRPSYGLGVQYKRMDLANKSGGLAGFASGFALGGPLGGLVGMKLGKKLARCKAKVLERRLNSDPAFRAKFEARVGGRYIPDGRIDGKITIARPTFKLPGLNPGIFGAMGMRPAAGSCLSGLARMMGNAANLMGQITGQGGQNGLSQIQGQSKAGSAMSKLGPGATFEDLVAAFMADTIKESQKEIEQKMQELNKSNQARNGGGGFGNMLGGLGQAAGGIFGGMFGGPVGSMVGGQLGGAIGGAIGGGGAQSSNSASDNRQMMMEELKNLMNKLQQMQQAMSNVLNTMHQGAMNSIRNIRA